MRVSKIELTALLKQAFEGSGFDTGACETAAEMVVASELYGFDGLLELQARLSEPGCLSLLSPTMVGDVEDQASFDGAHANLLQIGDLCSNVVFANAVKSGFCVGKITNCAGSSWIVRKLLDAQNYGLHAAAYWLDQHQTDLLHIARCALVNVDETTRDDEQVEVNQPTDDLLRYPEISSFLLTRSELTELLEAERDFGMTLAVAAQATRLASHLQQSLPTTSSALMHMHSAGQSRQHYLRLLTNGIDISDELWKALIKLGNNVLVESTEQSRMGAGA